LAHPRYEAMEAYLDRWGIAGRTMMCSTASIQVNLEAGGTAGPDGGARERWDLLHVVGPALVAAFANSPAATGPWAGWRSARLGVWLALDPARTVEPVPAPGETLAQTWARWCLDAPLMLVRRKHGPWTAPAGASFRDWLTHGEAVVPDRPPPTEDDLAYHLTTLFPPVRARGHLEVRYLDAQPGAWWQVPVSVLAALTEDPGAGELAREACAPVRGRWRDAARSGLADDALARAARTVVEVAARSLRARPFTAPAASAVEAYLDRWTARRRSPADDVEAGRGIPAAPTPWRPVSQQEGSC
jgi:glutamate--cysteine ligase